MGVFSKRGLTPFSHNSLSGNYCTDKKPSSINWIEGRGKSVVCEAIIKGSVTELRYHRLCLIGFFVSISGYREECAEDDSESHGGTQHAEEFGGLSYGRVHWCDARPWFYPAWLAHTEHLVNFLVGGFNAHAANIVTAMFIATGQDPAQNVESSNCLTLMEPYISRCFDLAHYPTC